MECSIYALIACFSWGGFYVDGGLSYNDSSLPHQEWNATRNQLDGVIETIITQSTTDRADNPYGRIAVGYQMDFNTIVLSFEASHTSSLATNEDRGINGISLKARWFPFRR